MYDADEDFKTLRVTLARYELALGADWGDTELWRDKEKTSAAVGRLEFDRDKLALEVDELRLEIAKCHDDLHEVRPKLKTVPGHGPVSAKLMIIGESPSRQSAETGLPFIGQSGNLLDKLLESINVKREECYITNVVKQFIARPPTKSEIKQNGLLLQEIDTVKPKFVVLLGNAARNAILGPSVERGWHYLLWYAGEDLSKDRIMAMHTFHPGYIASGLGFKYKAKLFEDFASIKELM